MVFARTGAGKGRSVVLPTLLHYAGPAIVVDPKGEAAAVTASYRRSLGPVYILDPYRVVTDTPDTFNPFDVVQRSGEEVAEQALLLNELLSGGERTSTKEPFWDNAAESLRSGVLAAHLSLDDPSLHTFSALRKALLADEPQYSLAVLLDTMGKKIAPFAYQEIARFLGISADQTRAGVLATAHQPLTFLGLEAVQASLDTTSIPLDVMQRGEESFTLYLVLPPEKLYPLRGLLRLWIGTLLNLMVTRRRRTTPATLLLVDEAAQFGHLQGLVSAATLMRGYGVRLWTFWQSLEQLGKTYPHDAQTLLDNSRDLIFFGQNRSSAHAAAKALHLNANELLALGKSDLLWVRDGLTAKRLRRLDVVNDRTYKSRATANPMYASHVR